MRKLAVGVVSFGCTKPGLQAKRMKKNRTVKENIERVENLH
jgi:hypothetical protein